MDEIASNHRNSTTPLNWPIMGTVYPKSQIVYFSQVLLIFIVVCTAIVNLTLYKDDEASGKLWTALLSSSIGYLLPNPSLKRSA
jgi:hypothetical protein